MGNEWGKRTEMSLEDFGNEGRIGECQCFESEGVLRTVSTLQIANISSYVAGKGTMKKRGMGCQAQRSNVQE